jgi:putative phage-type endonuclease
MDAQVLKLINKKQYEQRTSEWYAVRTTLITASSAASLLKNNDKTCDSYIDEYKLHDTFDKNNKCCNPYSNRNTFILDKCAKVPRAFTGNIAPYWGQKYEPVVTDIYSKSQSVNVLEFGLIIHDNYPFLGASPDGITEQGIMIEIKCPFRRKITGIPPFYYFIQCQLQLEICDLMYCDFVEFEFCEFATEEEWLDDTTLDIKILNKGLFIQYVEENTYIPLLDPSKSKYIYPPKEMIDSEVDLLKWKDENVFILNSKKNVKFNVIFWKATDNSIVRIKRDKEWFNNVLPTFEKEYRNILYYQTDDNYKKLLTPEKVYTEGKTIDLMSESECAFSDSESEN